MIALILILLGVLFLLNNFNLISPVDWESIWKFWPVILILWGLQVLLGRSFFTHLAVTIITIVSVFLLLSSFNPNLSLYLNSWLQNLQLK